jgi:8-oxo-dGTP pyrophosphatase MutT (NUDIX family)
MYITAATVSALESKFGRPVEIESAYEMRAREFEMVRRSQKHGRAHDVTFFIIHDNRIVVIKKPQYPPGAYRAPSGGVDPGEDFETGALREGYEETGLTIALQRYVLRSRVRFTCGPGQIDWTSHVFTAGIESGDLDPVDTEEIVEARFADVGELMGGIRNALLDSGSTGLRYRSELNDVVIQALQNQGLLRG